MVNVTLCKRNCSSIYHSLRPKNTRLRNDASSTGVRFCHVIKYHVILWGFSFEFIETELTAAGVPAAGRAKVCANRKIAPITNLKLPNVILILCPPATDNHSRSRSIPDYSSIDRERGGHARARLLLDCLRISQNQGAELINRWVSREA